MRGGPDMIYEPRTLENGLARLEPIAPRHSEALRAAAADPSIWTYLRINAEGPRFDAWFEDARDAHAGGGAAVYAAHCPRLGRMVGSTGFLCIDRRNRVLQMGHTWFEPSACGTGFNLATKVLLLDAAFEAGANRVSLRADGRNARSRRAIESLGATFEGVLRDHMVLDDGMVRDTACYSIVAREWAELRGSLAGRLASRGEAPQTRAA